MVLNWGQEQITFNLIIVTKLLLPRPTFFQILNSTNALDTVYHQHYFATFQITFRPVTE